MSPFDINAPLPPPTSRRKSHVAVTGVLTPFAKYVAACALFGFVSAVVLSQSGFTAQLLHIIASSHR